MQEPLEHFRQWDLYEKKLDNSKKVKLYIGELLKNWIIKIHNPLEIPVVLNLIEEKPEVFENKLSYIENHIGIENLKAYMRELGSRKISTPDQIFQRIISQVYEIRVYDELIKNSRYIKKIDSLGDWETENKIISVKSILDLDLNYQLIENLLRSFFYIKEYEIIRRYNSIWLKNAKKDFNYRFRNMVLEYLRTNIINILQVHDLMYLKYPEIGETKDYDFSDLKISIDTFIDHNKQKTITVHFASKNKNSSELTIEFKEDINNNTFYGIQYDTNGYFIGPSNFNDDIIVERISEHISEFDKKLLNYKITKSFEGWITLSIHAKDEEYFLKNEKSFQDKLSKVRFNKDYKIYLFIIPQYGFDLKSKLLFEI